MPWWMVVVLLASGFALLFGVEGIDLDYDRQVRGHKVVLTLETEWRGLDLEGEFGAVFEDSGRVRPSVGLKVDLSPSSPSPFRLETLPQMRLEILSPEGLRVRVGDRVQVGEVVAVRDPGEYEQILKALDAALEDGEEELAQELRRRKEAQEIRSLLEGEVVHLGLYQDGQTLTVVIYLSPVPVSALSLSHEGEVK